jgi:hypothetical protein
MTIVRLKRTECILLYLSSRSLYSYSLLSSIHFGIQSAASEILLSLPSIRVVNKVSMIYIMDIYHDFIMIFCGENIMIYIDENIRTILL